MSSRAFYLRLLYVILGVVSFNILGIQVLVAFGVGATWRDFFSILTYPLPMAAGLVGLYCWIAYWYCGPPRRFLDADRRGEKVSAKLLEAVQDRCLNLPYFLAALSFPAYMSGGYLGVKIIGHFLHWADGAAGYGLLGGVIAGLFTTPMSVYGAAWVMRPVLARAAELLPEAEAARAAGWRVTLRRKFVLIVVVLVLGITGYALIIAYAQTTAVLEDLERMEQLLPPAAAAKLVDRIERTTDPGIRSVRYYRDKLGNLKAFYLTLMLIGSGLALALAIAAARETARPIEALRAAAERARGRSDDPWVRLVSNDELAELGAAFNRMLGTIRGQLADREAVVENLRAGVRTMDETFGLVLAVGADQSAGATQQAGAVQQTSTIVEELVSTARQISERAERMRKSASKTLNACHDGRRRLDETQKAFQEVADQVQAIQNSMAHLEDRFKETFKIFEMMGEITDQTELLALNAALEAAGAGDTGKRFMVVADATQRLAKRAAAATQDIRMIVKDIRLATQASTAIAAVGKDKVAAGTQALQGAAKVINTVSELAEANFSSIHEISSSTEEQTSASEQLAGSVAEVREVAKKVAEGAKEIESSISELREFAENLRRTIEGKPGDAKPAAGA